PDILRTVPNLRGIYSSAAGNAGLLTCLEREGRRDDLVVIAHELTPVSRRALETGVFDAVISQNAGHLVRSAVRLLKATADQVPFDETQERIRIDIYLQDNMPPE
ncbi:MAG: substrate-binding domain-containing protein, partial [Pseudomonadota bacterium]